MAQNPKDLDRVAPAAHFILRRERSLVNVGQHICLETCSTTLPSLVLYFNGKRFPREKNSVSIKNKRAYEDDRSHCPLVAAKQFLAGPDKLGAFVCYRSPWRHGHAQSFSLLTFLKPSRGYPVDIQLSRSERRKHCRHSRNSIVFGGQDPILRRRGKFLYVRRMGIEF